MTDYKNELRSVLYDFLGDFKEKRYLSEGNTDEAIAKLEALLSKRELEARENTVEELVKYAQDAWVGEMPNGTQTIEPVVKLSIIKAVANQLTNREEK